MDVAAWADEYNERLEQRREMEIDEARTQVASTDVMVQLRQRMDDSNERRVAVEWHRKRMSQVGKGGSQ